ncbi:macrophage colony-stimulating factor 1 receptor 1-like isoform X2 [Folsomia candida]|uniref:macrophage colony-stimulating factor 1 receptor 1-like isoform X2 n=1 Tax=Folsomia candida TaxID=158441 RepID=UPI0016055790|nr:macrophage colony-stimulating factor 1 receptor 1-like isoform X2 [Folsomia candida]
MLEMCRFTKLKILLAVWPIVFQLALSQFDCRLNFDARAEIFGIRWISVSEKAKKASANGIFCGVRERSVINYHIGKTQEYNYNEKINWANASCSSRNILMFDGGRPDKQKLGDPWTEEQYFVSILCASPSPIKFTFIGLQPLTKVNTLQDYDMAMQRFRLTITIPYVGDKTGNYTFSSGIKSNNNSIFSEDWIYIYFKKTSPPYIIGQRTRRSVYWENHPHLGKTHILVPCRLTNPEIASEMQLLVPESKWGPSFIEINGTGITYNPAEGFTVDRSVVNQNQSHKFMCKQGSHRDREVIYDSPLTPPKIVNDTGIIKKFQQLSLGCAILTNRTWDYISNIYATTQMEADMLQDCLYRHVRCDWNTEWEVSGERVLEETKLNRRVVSCASDPVNYPCALIDIFRSGMVACFQNGALIQKEQYFTGMDNKPYLMSELHASKVPMEALATLRFNVGQIPVRGTDPQEDPRVFYSDVTYSFMCSAVPFLVIPGYTWSSKFRNGTTVENLGPNSPTQEWAGVDKAKGIRHENVWLQFSSDVESLTCNFYTSESNEKFKVKLDLTVKDKTVPKFIFTQTNITFAKRSPALAIRCSVFGIPLPEVSWFHDNELLTTSSEIRIVDGDVIHLDLRLSNTTHSLNGTHHELQAGEYVCTAKNSRGTVSQVYRVSPDEDLPTPQSSTYWIISVSVMGSLILITILTLYKVYKSKYVLLTKDDLEKFKNGEGLVPMDEGQKSGEDIPDNFKMIAYNTEYEISSKDYEIDYNKILGSGQFGVVLRGKLRGKDIAVKTVQGNVDRESLLSFMDEIKVMIYLGSHPNLIELVGSDTKGLEKGRVFLLVEFCPMGNLLKFLRDKTQRFRRTPLNTRNVINARRENPNDFDENKLLSWCFQITRGMNYLTGKKVVHGDLACRNVLLADMNTVKITDFGLSRQLHNYAIYKKTKNQALPWRWLSPEALSEMQFSTNSDIWAFGVTLWEVFSLGSVPYSGLGWNVAFVDKLYEGLRLQRPALASPEIFGLMEKCWAEVAEDRPQFSFIEDKIRALLQQKEVESNIYTSI